MSKPLKKIGEIDLPGIGRFDVAKNDCYHLVDTQTVDAYGNPTAIEISLDNYSHLPLKDLAQALLDQLGDHMVRLQHQREARLGGDNNG